MQLTINIGLKILAICGLPLSLAIILKNRKKSPTKRNNLLYQIIMNIYISLWLIETVCKLYHSVSGLRKFLNKVLIQYYDPRATNASVNLSITGMVLQKYHEIVRPMSQYLQREFHELSKPHF